ncbi:hypothetical protein FNH05_31555 [Amycolatopsis rhizosphaerae]|uniref:Uncharacterized protein n=1 Tax=Amycolatopsis rhizosphaerae TaxID=2053003 RepID=A0A558APY7_9PSEU|nr:hypothetical protein [Amycolatopsis rhizosphaerae]TVT26319.1 hypothetical protein FNH05_31555 [Amycolatopsis rhizosphaerae]
MKVSEEALAYEIFGPLWGLVHLGAAASMPPRGPGESRVADFARSRGGELERILGLVARIGGLSPAVLDLFRNQAVWVSAPDTTVADIVGYLAIHSGSIEDFPPDLADPEVLGRVVAVGGDLQLASLLHALVGAAVGRPAELTGELAPDIVEAVRLAGALAGPEHVTAPSQTLRLWRTALLPGVLRPDSPSPTEIKAGFRRYAHVLGRLAA